MKCFEEEFLYYNFHWWKWTFVAPCPVCMSPPRLYVTKDKAIMAMTRPCPALPLCRIAPCVCLLPGPKTICCKLHYGLFKLICCLQTWRDCVSIHTTTLNLPASWPQTLIVTTSVQDGRSDIAWDCVSERIPSLCSPVFTLSPSEIRKTESPCCVALTHHN